MLRQHYALIHAVCLRITTNRADAEDAAQEALIGMVRGLSTFDGSSKLSTWAYRIAANAALDQIRRRSRRPIPVDDAERQAVLSPDPAVAVSDRMEIEAALATLSPEFRAAVVLRDLVGMSYAEMADTLAVPVGTVRSRIARGRAALAEVLGNLRGAQRRPTT